MHYINGKFVKSAVYEVVFQIEQYLNYKEYDLARDLQVYL